mmetsp:Transcript_15767/g.37588  ORF Transcript_15767/g.37588 Transcript_15767/m.37588 type:complete len:122 (-) Transcript_15767:23-388(-)
MVQASMATRSRKLLVYTYGKSVMKTPPKGSQRHFNACVLNGKGAGLDLKKMRGTDPELQHVVGRCRMFPEFIRMVVELIEREDLQCVSVYCSKGRHRSVAAAEILRRMYYPEATVQHLTIK